MIRHQTSAQEFACVFQRLHGEDADDADEDDDDDDDDDDYYDDDDDDDDGGGGGGASEFSFAVTLSEEPMSLETIKAPPMDVAWLSLVAVLLHHARGGGFVAIVGSLQPCPIPR